MRLPYRFAVLTLVLVASPLSTPADEEPSFVDVVRRQVRQLDPKGNDPAARLAALKWMGESGATRYAALILPALERSLRSDPDAPVREKAAELFGLTAFQQKPRVCPRALVEGMRDRDENVRGICYGVASMFKEFAPGCRQVLLRCLQEGDSNTRANAVSLLWDTGKDEQTLQRLRQLTRDRDLWVRDAAYAALFRATDRLEEIVPYKFQVLLDSVPPRPPGPKTTEAESRDRAKKNLMAVSASLYLYLWTRERTDEMAGILLKLMKHESPRMREAVAKLLAGVGEEVLRLRKAKHAPKPGGARTGEFEYPRLLDPVVPDGKPRATPEQQLRRLEKVVARLAELKVEAGLQRLRDHDPEPSVRTAAATALQQLSAAKGKRESLSGIGP
jgi:HEAT repeat protein